MDIAKLKKKLILQRKGARIPDGGGGYTDSWANVRELWAGVEPLDPEEITEAQQKKQENTHIVTTRYNPDIKRNDRFKYAGRYLMVVTIQNVKEENRFLRVYCKESG